MTDATSALLSQALQLSAAERGELMDRLADSLDPPQELEEVPDDDFATELHRRAAELRADPTAGIPWDDVKGMR